MNRGESLVEDLKVMVNNSRFSDVKIKCSDYKDNNDILYGCRMVLAARCEVFEKLLFNGMRETHEPEIVFPEISTLAMKVVLEFIYTGTVDENNLNVTNAIDVYYAANYLLLPALEEVTFSFIERILSSNIKTSIVKLFSAMITKFDVQEFKESRLFQLLCKKMMKIPLGTLAFEEISFDVLKVLLSQTLDQDEYFATSEYGVFRYVVLWGANKVSTQALAAYVKVLPPDDSVEAFCDELSQKNEELIEESKYRKYRQQILKQIGHLLPLINLKLINMRILALIIDPLRLNCVECLNKAYRFHAISNNPTKTTRGSFVNRKITWDKTKCGPHLIVNDDGTIVESFIRNRSQMVIAKQAFKGEDFLQWDIVIEKTTKYVAIGVISYTEIEKPEPELSKSLIWQPNCWCISSDGSYHDLTSSRGYELEAFKEGDTVTTHLDMSKRTLSFSINGRKMETAFRNIADKVYPAISLSSLGKLRIKSLSLPEEKLSTDFKPDYNDMGNASWWDTTESETNGWD
ncbi:4880_t:CDS:1 [Ambispora leptoticha]|uniref:4880_t:CDS:1 n=1 Tax=Ambispora leptoticha TaxID=144679 RepID=A0A9N9D8X0_9GLOM|nr:4880_t:CDS:1 [Ambispora leptoticha]